MYEIGLGSGKYNNDVDPLQFNTKNPPRVDTATGMPAQYGNQRGVQPQIKGAWMEPCGWIALRFVADNAGMWLFHCHIDWHVEMGMGFAFDISSEKSPPPPLDYQFCGSVFPSSFTASTTPLIASSSNSDWRIGKNSLAVVVVLFLFLFIAYLAFFFFAFHYWKPKKPPLIPEAAISPIHDFNSIELRASSRGN